MEMEKLRSTIACGIVDAVEDDKVMGEESIINSCLHFKTLQATCMFVVFNNLNCISL